MVPISAGTLSVVRVKYNIQQMPARAAGKAVMIMNASPHDRRTQEVAREICLRTGTKAMLAGSIAALGSHFAITLKAVNCQSGDSLGAAEAEADSREKVLGALGQAATELRGELGESLASIQKFDKPLEQVTTSSLEALKAYTDGDKIQGEKGDTEALPFVKRAVELDPSFAEAHVALGTLYSNLGQSSLAQEHYKKAYELRDRVSLREKYDIMSNYYRDNTGELDKAAQQFELWIHDYPHDPDVHGNLGLIYATLGQHEKAAALTREELKLRQDGYGYFNLANDYIALNRLDEAKAILDQARHLETGAEDIFFPLEQVLSRSGEDGLDEGRLVNGHALDVLREGGIDFGGVDDDAAFLAFLVDDPLVQEQR